MLAATQVALRNTEKLLSGSLLLDQSDPQSRLNIKATTPAPKLISQHMVSRGPGPRTRDQMPGQEFRFKS